MLRVWAATALLASSWLAGLNYYHQANTAAWSAMVAAGVLLLTGTLRRLPAPRDALIAAIMVAPAAVLMPWPHRLAALLVFAGLVVTALPIPVRWPRAVAGGMLAAGTILVVQALAMLAYAEFTARCPNLPGPLDHVPAIMGRLMGIHAGLAGGDVTMHSMRQPHHLGATWALLVDPASLCWVIGGIAFLMLGSWSGSPGEGRGPSPWSRGLRLIILTAAWLPVRAGLLMSVYLHRVLRTDYDSALAVMGQFWSVWVHLLLLGVPVLLAWRFIRLAGDGAAERPDVPSLQRGWPVAVLGFTSVALIAAGLLWNPVGARKSGRVAIDEYHSAWEPTVRPFDTSWYGNDSGYNYACLYDYCSRFYTMSRITQPIGGSLLGDVDVLILKVPNLSAYSPDEIAAIRQYVEEGGSLLLIGEHTDVFKTGTHLNDVARVFGFQFRPDCLFGVDSVFEQLYRPPLAAHPIVQYFPALDFAVSCSIDPGLSPGRAAILGTGLKNLGADYHASNFYPQAEDHAEMRYGAFVQLWTTTRGRGRVAAFTDSTQFSNFCVFDPGKSELFVGMVEWLNHRESGTDVRPVLAMAGAVIGLVSLAVARRRPGGWATLLGAGLLACTGSALAVEAAQRAAMPFPPQLSPMTRVVFDQGVCDPGLPTNGFIAGKEDHFGIFERWVLRLGYFTSRASDAAVFGGDLVIFVCPDRQVPPSFRQRMVEYVSRGGNVLVMDSMGNRHSSANSLLYPFKLSINRSRPAGGSLVCEVAAAPVPVDAACEVTGGRAWARIGDVPVGATVRHGKGTVTAISFGSRFSDYSMGITGDVVPDDKLREVYDVEYGMLRAIVAGRTATSSAAE